MFPVTSLVTSVFNILGSAGAGRISKLAFIGLAIHSAITPATIANPMPSNSSFVTPADFLVRNHEVWSVGDPAIFAESAKGQTPSLFWLGCSDSRVSESHLIQSGVGEVFVHRNIANLYHPGDASATAALAYAVNHLKVPHIAVVGHENCGGCAAALGLASSSHWRQKISSKWTAKWRKEEDPNMAGEKVIGMWLEPIQKLAVKVLLNNPFAGLSDVVAANVQAQVKNVAEHPIVTNAWARGQSVTVQGWVYDIGTGKLKDQGVTRTGPDASS